MYKKILIYNLIYHFNLVIILRPFHKLMISFFDFADHLNTMFENQNQHFHPFQIEICPVLAGMRKRIVNWNSPRHFQNLSMNLPQN